MRGVGCYYIFCKNTCVCEVNKLERRFYLVDAQVLPEVFLKVVRAKELLASGEARSISAATRSVDLSRSAFYKYKDCIFDSENGREVPSQRTGIAIRCRKSMSFFAQSVSRLVVSGSDVRGALDTAA